MDYCGMLTNLKIAANYLGMSVPLFNRIQIDALQGCALKVIVSLSMSTRRDLITALSGEWQPCLPSTGYCSPCVMSCCQMSPLVAFRKHFEIEKNPKYVETMLTYRFSDVNNTLDADHWEIYCYIPTLFSLHTYDVYVTSGRTQGELLFFF